MESLHRLLRDDSVTRLFGPGIVVGGVLDSTDAVLDWLLPESVKTPTDTPKQAQPNVELMVTSPPAKDCDAVALPGSTDSQNVSVQSRFVYLRTGFFAV